MPGDGDDSDGMIDVESIDDRLASIERQARVVREAILDDVADVRYQLERALDATRDEREFHLRQGLQLLERLDTPLDTVDIADPGEGEDED